jgi:hypothetical protein
MDMLIIMAVLEWLPCIITPCHFNNSTDAFGIHEIYPTAPGGREWFIDMNNPTSDGVFDPGTAITRNPDGSWRVSGEDNGKYQVRMNVNTPAGFKEWKNVEITGYARVAVSFPPNPGHNALTWYARGGVHSISAPCDGTSLKGRLHVGGGADWLKEIWHAGGYTSPLGKTNATDLVTGRWIGWKVAIYNIDNDTAVKMESYIDDSVTNSWRQVSSLTDRGGWYASDSDAEFYSIDCGKPKDYIITNSGTTATFRSDRIVWDFKSLSVREIATS